MSSTNQWRGETMAGLDIGMGYVSVSRAVRDSGGGIRLANEGTVSCSPDVDDRELVKMIASLMRKVRMPTSTVCTCMSSHSVLIRHFSHRNVTSEELGSVLRIEAEEAIRLPPEELCVDWHIRSEVASPEVLEGIMIAAPRPRVSRHLQILRDAGLYPVILDVRCLAVANLFRTMTPASSAAGSVHVSNLSPRVADMAVLSDGDRLSPRSVAASSGTWCDSPKSLSDQFVEQIRFAELKLGWPRVAEIHVTGELAGDENLRNIIARDTGLPVSLWNPFANGHSGEGLKLAASAGLAIRGLS